MSQGRTGSSLNSGMRPSLVSGNGGKGMIASSAQPGHIPQPIKSGQLWVDSFGNSRYKLGVLINSPGQFWNDLDLFQVTASNNMLLSDVFIWKLVSTSAMNSITTILAPKVAVPNDIHTFTGRTMYYHVQPANDVPKRGTVRTMSKSMEEWVAHLSQKGMGSHIEGGSLRTPQGKRFLDQEVIAIAWSIELNMVLNTVNTMINSAIVSSFNYNKQESPVINAVSMGRALNREFEIFCAGCGTTKTLQTLLSNYIETVPNADVLYMTNRLGANLQFAGEIPGSDLPHKSYAMIPDQNGVSVPVSIVGRNRTRTLKTIAGGTISVLAMPTFGFRGGESRYNPLEHDFTCGNHWVLNAERGLVPWDKLSLPNMDCKSSYCSEMLNQEIYDHNLDRRERVDFKTAMKYAHVFNTVGDRYQVLGGTTLVDMMHYLEGLYSEDMTKFATAYGLIDTSHYSNIYDRLSPSNSYIINILEKTSAGIRGKTGMLVNEAPISSDARVIGHHGTSNNSHDRVGFHEAVQRFKENVQFPLSRTYDSTNIGASLTNLRLPTTIGDLDPFHLLGVNFKCCVHDAKQDFMELFQSDEYNAFRELKRMLNSTKLNAEYWNLVRQLNNPQQIAIGKDPDAIKTAGKSYFYLSDYARAHVAPSVKQGWPLDERSDFMIVPTYEQYADHIIKKDKNANPGKDEDYIPQGMWSVRGLQYLSNPNILAQMKFSRLAELALRFLEVFSRKISEMFPFSTVSNAKDLVGSLIRFLPPNTIVSRLDYIDTDHAVTSEADMQQIIMSLFDEKLEMVAVSLTQTGVTGDEEEEEEEEAIRKIKPLDVPTGPVLKIMDVHVPKREKFEEANEMRATIYVETGDVINPMYEVYEMHFSGPPWSFFQEDIDPSSADFFLTNADVIKRRDDGIKDGSTDDEKVVFMVVSLLAKLGHAISRRTMKLLNEASLYTALQTQLVKDVIETITPSIMIHVLPVTIARTVSTEYFLTPFVVSTTQIATVPEGMKFHDMHTLATYDNTNPMDTKEEHVHKICRIVPETNTTGWREERLKEFVVNLVPKKQWTALDKIISLFIIETQMSLPSADYWIRQGLRPYFEICLWRLFQRQRFEGLLLAKSGISTAMNPYNNAHIAMGVDATTDQYNIRAVIQTDCVVINSQNLAFVPCVSPTQYLGGRNTSFITSPDEIMNTDKDLDKIPSFIATIVSYGYMATTDYPLSFINNPPGRIANGFVTDVNMSTQFWPGAHFYFQHIFKSLFFSADKVYQGLKLDMNSDQHKRFVQWYRAQMDGNHVSTPGYSKCYDPMTNNFTYELPGKGAYQHSFMNDCGARMVFEGVSANFKIQHRIETSNT